jgi:hypothetical protein
MPSANRPCLAVISLPTLLLATRSIEKLRGRESYEEQRRRQLIQHSFDLVIVASILRLRSGKIHD